MKKVTILDGSMGQELLNRSAREVTPMWSADIMLHEPHLVTQLHLDYINAGADVITLNTYTATPSRLTREGYIKELHNLHNSAMQAATQAVKQAKQNANNRQIKIAGCLPPLVASYKAEAILPFADSLAQYRQLVDLQAPSSDLFICETMSSISEAKAACIAAKEIQKDVWLALSVKDDQSNCLRSGESLSAAIDALRLLNPDAILLNCSKPEAINSAWTAIESLPYRIGAYANGFTSVESLYPGDTVKDLQSRQDLGPNAYAKHALNWIDKGATIVGGCCEIGPLHIARIKELIA